MITIDGSYGEGGGQILRTALSLSLVTGEPFRVIHIRAGRDKPGLLRQHLTAVRAAAEVGTADTAGVELGSLEFSFTPRQIRSGDYLFSIGTAGSSTLVLQTILPALCLVRGPSAVTIEGGTHNHFAPPFDFIQKSYLPLLNRMGPAVGGRVIRHGFFPVGGGRIKATVQPVNALSRIDLTERGNIKGYRVRGIVSKLSLEIAEREVGTILKKMSLPKNCGSAERVDSPGPGNVVTIEVECEHITEVFTGFGKKGVPAEQVAADAAREANEYISSGVPVGKYLADQLLVPMALAGGGSFVIQAPTSHFKTNAFVIGRFLDVAIDAEPVSDAAWRVAVRS